MKIFGYQFIKDEQEKRMTVEQFLSAFGLLYPTATTTIDDTSSLKLSAVYRCVSVISDSIATMPFEPYTIQGDTYLVDRNHYSYNMCNREPHPLYSRFTFFKTLVSNMLLHGNAYAVINRDKKGNPVSLQMLFPPDVTIYTNINEGNIKYKINGVTGFIDDSNMIHLINHTADGIVGISTIQYAATILGLATAADKQAKGFYESGANMSGIINVEGRVTKEKAQEIKGAWKQAFSPYMEGGQAGGVAVMEKGMQYTAVQVSPRDAQMLEAREFNVIEICRFFGVSPTKAFDMRFSSYNNVSGYQLSYITDTLTPLTEKIENEFARKLYRPSERLKTEARFNVESLFRADLDSKSNYYQKLFSIGGMTTNEIRKAIGNTPVAFGDEPMAMVNMQPLSKFYSNNVNNKGTNL